MLPSPRPRVALTGPGGVLLGLLAACGVDPLPGGQDGSTGDTGQAPVLGLGTLEGLLLDGAGAPVPGAALTTVPRGYVATSDADGRFRIDLLPPDGYQVVAWAEGWQAARSVQVQVQADQVASVELALVEPAAPGGTVRVRVLGPDGLPLPGAQVSASTGQAATTDEDGRVELAGVVGADLALRVDADSTWPRQLQALSIDDAGGAQWQVQLSGRPDEGSPIIGSAVCAMCHADQGAAHAGTLHARAHSTEPGQELAALFQAGASVDLGNGAAAALQVDGEGWQVTLTDAGGTALALPVAGFIGDPDRATVPWAELGEQGYPLPLAFVATDPERPDYPEAAARLVPMELERWFDEAGRFALPGGTPDPATSADRACLPCHVSGFEATPRSDGGMDLVALLGEGRWSEEGVSCERCHGPGGDHIDTATDQKAFAITRPGLLDPQGALDVCGQCHARGLSLDETLPWPWTAERGAFQPGEALADFATSDALHWPSGAAAATRMQVDELALSGHGAAAAGPMGCPDCHEPHGASVDAQGQPHDQGLRAAPDDNALCLSCHLGLDFGGEEASAAAHTGHLVYDPQSAQEHGRCTGCHMPRTATDLSWGSLSAAGDHASHLFDFTEPQVTVDWFDLAGLDQMAPGSFPVHGCVDCHAWNAWRWDATGSDFVGPHGDPTLRESHVEHQSAFEEMWP